MRRTLFRVAVVLSGAGVLGGAVGRAQDRPVVFIHGVASDSETWREAADRLEGRLAIVPERVDVSWRSSIESQASEVQARHAGSSASTIAVGHSLGGLVARQWSRSRELGGLVTIGTPHRGAPIVNHINEWLGFNSSLFAAVGTVFEGLGRSSYDQWWWVYPAVEGALNWGGYLADFSIRHLLVDMGMQFGFPFTHQIYVGAPYLDALNRDAGRESAVPSRVGIVNTAREYWRGGPFRLKTPEYAGELSVLTATAAAALDYYALQVYAEADPLDVQAHSIAFGLWDAAFWLWNFEEFWCRAISDNRPIWSGHCLPNDGLIPTWSQFHPGATVNFEVNGGPVHTEETEAFDEFVYAALTNFMHVPARGAASPGASPGSPPPAGGPDSLSGQQMLHAGEGLRSSDGRFRLLYQWDGNLVLYRQDGVAVWHSGTHGHSTGRMVMQHDGNLVIYDASDVAVWASGTAGLNSAWLILQNDGNLVIYTPSGGPAWSSGTAGW